MDREAQRVLIVILTVALGFVLHATGLYTFARACWVEAGLYALLTSPRRYL